MRSTLGLGPRPLLREPLLVGVLRRGIVLCHPFRKLAPDRLLDPSRGALLRRRRLRTVSLRIRVHL
jgi:hypothetical protein